jgi:CubicO group peptidase (beta-lactamase class C family)
MTVKPESAGMSSARLERIEQFLAEKYVGPGKLPGTSTLVARKGQIVHWGIQGHADKERGRKYADDTVFRIYSMTKPVASIALMMLVEEGRISLDDPVHRHIPAWKGLGVYKAGNHGAFQTAPTKRPMLVIDLLRHTSGLTYGFQERTNVDAAYRKFGIGVFGDKQITLEEMVEHLSTMPLEFSPGEAWNYSVSTDIVGYIVQAVSGQKFEDFVRQRILTPLKMPDTDFFVKPENQKRFAANYAFAQGHTFLYDDPAKSSYLAPPVLVSGGGGLVSTMSDYYRFCRMLIQGGELDGVRLVSPKTIGLMTMNHLPGGADLPSLSRALFSEAGYGGIGFGLGFSTTINVADTMMHGSLGDYSWGGAASTYFWVDPAEELICIFMTQLLPSTTYNVRRELRTLVYSAMTESLAA